MRNILLLMTALLMSIVTVSFDIKTDTLPDPPGYDQIESASVESVTVAFVNVKDASMQYARVESVPVEFISLEDASMQYASMEDVSTQDLSHPNLTAYSLPLTPNSPTSHMDNYHDPVSSRSLTTYHLPLTPNFPTTYLDNYHDPGSSI